MSSRNEDQDLCIISFVTDFGKPLASHACSCFVPFSYIRYSGLVMGPRFAYWVKDNVSYNIICIICIIIYLCLYVYIYIYIYIYIYLYIKCKYIYVSFSIYISIYLYRVFEWKTLNTSVCCFLQSIYSTKLFQMTNWRNNVFGENRST